MVRSQLRVILLAGLGLAAACSSGSPDPSVIAAREQEVRQAMDRYMAAARAVDPDAIAACFTPTATLFEPGILPVQTREKIRAFVASFPGVRVDIATATPETIEIFGDTALLWGAYFERLAFPGQPVSEQHGKFVVEWMRQPDGAWLIERYFRVPVPSSQ